MYVTLRAEYEFGESMEKVQMSINHKTKVHNYIKAFKHQNKKLMDLLKEEIGIKVMTHRDFLHLQLEY